MRFVELFWNMLVAHRKFPTCPPLARVCLCVLVRAWVRASVCVFQVTLVSVLFAARCGTVRHDTARCGMVRHSAPLSPDQNFSLLYSQRLVALYVGCRVYKLQVGTTVSGRLYLSLSHSFTGK
jgi:hypothetical protein